jgi:hypothetical protein
MPSPVRENVSMRIVSGIGAVVFGWLALIPFSLIVSTFDNACTGPGCETPLPVEVLFVALYCLTLLALGGTAVVFADHAIRGRAETLALEPVALRVCGAVVGVTLFLLFCTIAPVGGILATVIGVGTWRLLARFNPDAPDPRLAAAHARIRKASGPPPPDPTLN